MLLLVSVPYKSTLPLKNCSALIFLKPDFEKSRVSKFRSLLFVFWQYIVLIDYVPNRGIS